MTKPLPSTGKAISDCLIEMHDLLFELEADNKMYHIRFNEEDVMAACGIFMSVLGNIQTHNIIDGNVDYKEAVRTAKQLRQLVIDMTGYDPHEFYKRK